MRGRIVRGVFLLLAILGIAAAVAEPTWRRERVLPVDRSREFSSPRPPALPTPYPAGAEDSNVAVRDGESERR
jgi:hypothetical protein